MRGSSGPETAAIACFAHGTPRRTRATSSTASRRASFGSSAFRSAISPRPALYVAALDAEKQRVVVGTREDAARTTFRARAARWVSDPPEAGASCEVQIRHRGRPLAAEVEPLPGGDVGVRLREPALGIAPG